MTYLDYIVEMQEDNDGQTQWEQWWRKTLSDDDQSKQSSDKDNTTRVNWPARTFHNHKSISTKKTYFTFTFTGELPAMGRSPTARVCLVLHTLQRELRPVSAVTSDVDRIGGKDEGATKEEENNKFGQNLLCKCCCNLQSDVLLRMFCCAHGATVVQCLCNCALIQFVRIAMVCLGTLVCSSTSEVLCSLSDLTSLSTRNTRSQTPNTTSHFPNSKSWQIQICCTSLYNV